MNTLPVSLTQDWSDQRVVVIGAARQGIALARFLLRHNASVVLNDIRPLSDLAAAQASLVGLTNSEADRLSWVCGEHPLHMLDGTDLLCPSGGVPLTLPLIEEARQRGIRLSNDSLIFLQAAPCKVIGITGSAGKTTTTVLVGRIAEQEFKSRPGRVWVGGNIGSPLIAQVDEMQPDDLAIIELSSFQLEIMDLSPSVAAVLNVTPNHLDRHATMQAYTAAKARILDFQHLGDVAVLGRDDPGAWSLADRVQGGLLSFGLSELPVGQFGTYLHNGTIYMRSGATLAGEDASRSYTELPVMSQSEIRLRGAHNLLNVMAACTITAAAGLSNAVAPGSVNSFKGVPHRLEFVRNWGGADWYNDSMATAPERAIAAILSFDEPLVLLAGGRDKNLPWEDFALLVDQRVDHLVVFGEAADKILSAMQASNPKPNAGKLPSIIQCARLREAVQAAARVVQPGDVVLLSPGGTSFDEFYDFEERGACFVQWVNELE
jgi:UDP-N-acetylmuramoylalanine--D-glutamate ligase